MSGESAEGVAPRPVESAVIVPVLQADALLRAWKPRWEPPAPVGIPACVTIAYPFLSPDELGPDTLSGLAEIFAAQPPLAIRLAGVARWPGLVVVQPEPVEPFIALAEQVHARFPSSRTPGVAGGSLVPHLTALRSPDDALLDEAATTLAARLPLAVSVAEAWLVQATGGTRAWLVEGATGAERWTLRMRFPLGVNRY